MNMESLESGNGFVTKEMIQHRICWFVPPDDDYFCMEPLLGSHFSRIGVMAYNEQMFSIFEIYTGNKLIYEFVRRIFHEAVEELGYEARSKDWKDMDASPQPGDCLSMAGFMNMVAGGKNEDDGSKGSS